MDIAYLLKVIWRKKWLIIGLPIISSVAAFLFTMNMEDKFIATTQISTGFTTDEGINVSEERFNLRGVDVKFSNLLTTMKSGILYNLVSYDLLLHDTDPKGDPFRYVTEGNISFSAAEIDTARNILDEKLDGFEPITVNETHSGLLRNLRNSYGYTYDFISSNMEIKRVPNTDYIDISFVSDDPDLSAFVVNTYVDQFLRYYALSKNEISGESVEFFEKQLAKRKSEFEQATNQLRSFRERNNLLNIGTEGESRLARISELESKKDQVQQELYTLQLEESKWQRYLNDFNGNASTTNEVNNEKLVELNNKIDELNSRYAKSGFKDQQLADSLSRLQREKRIELNSVRKSDRTVTDQVYSKAEVEENLANTRIKIRGASRELSNYNTQISSISGSMPNYVANETQLKELQSKVEASEKDYNEARDRYEQEKVKQLASGSSVKQTYRAAPPASPMASKRIIIIALAGIATFGICVFVIVLLEVLDTSIKTPIQFQRVVDMDLAGTIIKVDTKKLNFHTLFAQQHKDEQLELFKHFLRKTRYEIENTGAKSFMVTSPKVGEGKTFTIFALAFVLSLIKRKVLIIDTNFKNNTLTKWLSTPKKNMKLLEKRNEPKMKLVDEKGSATDTDDSAVNLVTPTKYHNIYLIGNAGGYDSPEEIFHDRDFNDLMVALREEFDYIFIEGASLNEYSDSKELMKYVDKVIPIFSAESSIKQLDRDSIDYLLSMEDNLVGAILNKVDMENINV